MAELKRCEGPDCEVEFEPKRSTARFHSPTCRQRAGRARKAAEAEAAAEKDAGGDAEHGLVKAVRKELVEAEALDTVAGQLALQVARRIADPECSGVSGLSKELRALLAEAKGATPPDPAPEGGAEPVEEEDEVTKARRQREEARQAAGLA